MLYAVTLGSLSLSELGSLAALGVPEDLGE